MIFQAVAALFPFFKRLPQWKVNLTLRRNLFTSLRLRNVSPFCHRIFRRETTPAALPFATPSALKSSPPFLLLTLLLAPGIASADLPTPRKPSQKEQRSAKPVAVERSPAFVRQPLPLEAPPGKALRISLSDAYERTLATDQSIRTAWYEIRKANLTPWSALTRLGPSLTGSASYQVNERYSKAPTLMLDGTQQYLTTRTGGHTRGAGFTLVQPLFDPTAIPAYQRGRVNIASARLQYRYTIREVLFGVAQAYYNVLKLESIVKVSEQTVELASDQLEQAQTRVELGQVARIDALRGKATLEEARNSLIQAQGQLDLNRDTLSNILNLGGRTDFILSEPIAAPDTGIGIEEALRNAYTAREDYQIRKNDVQAERLRRNEIIAGYSPRITAQASTQWTNTSGSGNGETQVNTAVVSVSVPILTGGQREIDLKDAGHNIAISKINVESAAKVIEADVKSAWIAVRTGREALEALRAAVEAAEANYIDVQSFYETGASTSLDVQVALRELNNSRTLLANQVYDYQIALRDLERAQAAFESARVMRKAAGR